MVPLVPLRYLYKTLKNETYGNTSSSLAMAPFVYLVELQFTPAYSNTLQPTPTHTNTMQSHTLSFVLTALAIVKAVVYVSRNNK